MTLAQLPRHISPRQREIVALLWADHTVLEIARRLDSRPSTIRAHIKALATKLANPHGLPAVRLIKSYKLPSPIG